MAYWRLFYHLVWATKDRAALIDAVVAAAIEQSILATCEEPNVRLFAVGIMPDHVHLAASIPPRLALASFIGRLKGGASYAANGPDHGHGAPFAWQGEYGVLSFGEKALPDVVAYVRNQPARHAANDLWPALERATDTS